MPKGGGSTFAKRLKVHPDKTFSVAVNLTAREFIHTTVPSAVAALIEHGSAWIPLEDPGNSFRTQVEETWRAEEPTSESHSSTTDTSQPS